jgi:hypothetical protein
MKRVLLAVAVTAALASLGTSAANAQDVNRDAYRAAPPVVYPSISYYYPPTAVFLPYQPALQPNYAPIEMYYPTAWRYYPNIRFATDYYWYPYPYYGYNIHMPGVWYGPGRLP